MSTTDPKYPDWRIDDYNVARAGSITVVVVDYAYSCRPPPPEVEIEHNTAWSCTTDVRVPPFVLAAMLRQLGWTVTEPGGGT